LLLSIHYLTHLFFLHQFLSKYFFILVKSSFATFLYIVAPFQLSWVFKKIPLIESSLATFLYTIPHFYFSWVNFFSPNHLSKPFLPPFYMLQLLSISFELIFFPHEVFSLSLFNGVTPFHKFQVSFFSH